MDYNPTLTDQADPNSFNTEYAKSTFDTRNSLAQSIVGGTVATVADIGATLWNSLPFTENVETRDLLSGISDSAVNVYDANPETIQAASFIGGSLLGGGLAVKGVNALRSGAKGVSWFSEAGRAANLAKVDEAVRMGAAGTQELRAARMALLRNGIANNVLDAAVFETTMLATLNASPMLEDYFKDPVKNFGISLALGGGIGGIVGHIGDRFAVKAVIGKAESESFADVLKTQDEISYAAPDVGRMQVHNSNIESIQKLIETPSTDGLTKEIANKFLAEQRSAKGQLFEKMSSSDLNAMTLEQRNTVMDMVVGLDGMAGANSIKHFVPPVSDIEKIGYKAKSSLVDDFVPSVTKDVTGKTTEITDVVYHPEYDSYSTVNSAINVSKARDLGITTSEIQLAAKEINLNTARNDMAFSINSQSAPLVDKNYLTSMNAVDNLAIKELKNIVVDPDDLPLMNALMARYRKSPSDFDGVSMVATKAKPSYKELAKGVLQNAKVQANHLDELEKMAVAGSKFNLQGASTSLSPKTSKLLSAWVSGSGGAKAELRAGADLALRGGGGYSTPASKAVREMYDSTESVAARNNLIANKIADVDGNIYLYRGTATGKTLGHSPIESYTPVVGVARRFGNPKLYKVHVEDIIGIVQNGLHEFEYLVGSSTRPSIAKIPVGSSGRVASGKVVEEWDINNVSERLLSRKDEVISNMVARGMGMEEIAIRTNTPVNTVKGFVVGLQNGEGLKDLMAKGTDFSPISYGSVNDLDMYLDPTQRALRVSSSVHKVKYSELASGLDVNLGLNANREYINTVLGTSQSNTAQNFYAIFSERGPILDILRSSISEIANGKLGNAFISSADFFLRDTSVGRIVTTIGKDLNAIASNSIKPLITPLSEAMGAIRSKGETAIYEANLALNINSGLKGARYWDEATGTFFTKTKVNGREEIQTVQHNGTDYIVQTPEVRALLTKLATAGREAFHLKNTVNQITGRAPISDLGFWTIPFNPRDKQLAYVWNTETNSTKLLWGRNTEDLKINIASFEATQPVAPNGTKAYKIITKQDQVDEFNSLHSRFDPMTMDIANVEMKHTGASQSAIVRNNTDIFNEIIGGYENYIESNVKRMAQYTMHDTIDSLSKMSHYNKAYQEAQPLGKVAKLSGKDKDGAAIVRNMLLGNNSIAEFQAWQQHNENFETVANWGLNTIGKAFKESGSFFSGLLGKGGLVNEESLNRLDYLKFSTKLLQEGIPNVFGAFDDAAAKLYGVAKVQDIPNTTKRAIYASNAFSATYALRVLDLASPLVNAMSLPILTGLAKMQQMPEVLMGANRVKGKMPSTTGILFEGARLSNSSVGKVLGEKWEKAGYFNSMISEANDTLRQARSFGKQDISSKIEKGLDNGLINTLSKPADWTEAFLRRQIMYTGAALGKRMYPTLGDEGITIFARDFMDRSMGNYHAGQRPVFFQGTMGTALGLFQTYMLTLGQSIYRSLELKDYKTLGKAMLTQTGIFGGKSLPGFDVISNTIGDHFSDENYDLTTGTFRDLPDSVANTVLYGLPSSMGPALYTRGDVNPRLVPPTDATKLAAVNMVGQTLQFGSNMVQAMGQNGDSVAKSLAQAISLQSVSRPLARVSELFTGYSVTGAGNTVGTPEEVYTGVGITSRLLSARPLEEAKAREVLHLNTVYGQLDRDHRATYTKELKLAARNGVLSNDKLEELANGYMRYGGSSTGWRGVVNDAISGTDMTATDKLHIKLHPNSALNHMIDSLDGE